MSAENKTHVKYLSFKNSIRVDKIAELHLNRLLNGKVKYERLDELQLSVTVRYNRQQGNVGQLLMSAKVKGISIFNGVEQGSKYHSNKVYMYFKLNMTSEAKEWIRKVYRKIFKVKDKETYETSVRVFNQEEEKYSN